MAASRYILCPRGCGNSSHRLFESMSLGTASVIPPDKWRPVEGVDWSFALFLPERNIPRLDRILREPEHECEQRGQAALAAHQEFFSPAAIP